jgi:two-component system, cell cycle sensor histidine kinase and response regulator CckA
VPGRRPTILVVDDEGSIRESLVDILDDHGYAVLAAADPETALSLAKAHGGRIDVLVTDVVMRYMSGRELAMRLAKSRPDIAVIYMSGFDYDNIGHLGVMGPGSVFLQKPFTSDVLVATVQRILAAR